MDQDQDKGEARFETEMGRTIGSAAASKTAHLLFQRHPRRITSVNYPYLDQRGVEY